MFSVICPCQSYSQNITQLISTHISWEKVSSKIQFMLFEFSFKLSIYSLKCLGKVIHKVGLSWLIPRWVEKRLYAKLHTRWIKKLRNCATKPQQLWPLQLLYRLCGRYGDPTNSIHSCVIRFFIEILDLLSLMLLANLFTKEDWNDWHPYGGGKRLDAIGHTRRNMKLRNCAIKPQ